MYSTLNWVRIALKMDSKLQQIWAWMMLRFATINSSTVIRIALKFGSILQRIGAWLMLLSSFALFNIVTWIPYEPVYLFYYSAGILTGAVLAHGTQKTTTKFVKNLGLNFYIMGWAAIARSLGVANTVFDLYVSGFLGIHMIFIGVVLYFLLEGNPTLFHIATHLVIGLYLMIAGLVAFFIAYFELEVIVLYFFPLGRLPTLWNNKAFVTFLVGNGFLLTSLFMYHLFKKL